MKVLGFTLSGAKCLGASVTRQNDPIDGEYRKAEKLDLASLAHDMPDQHQGTVLLELGCT
jgi:hypothetical protein